MSKIYVKPLPGMTVPLPRNTPVGPYPVVPADGMWVELDTFISRRLADGDLVEVTPPASAPASDQTPVAIAAPAAATKQTGSEGA